MTDTNPLAPLYAAMAKAFPEIEGASKDKNNPAFKTKYADLGSVMDAVKPALANHGLWFRQVTHLAEAGVCIETFICHESGCELSGGHLFVPADKSNAQGYGSALTYAKRYSLQTTFGIPAEDDDGNAASAKRGPEYVTAAEAKHIEKVAEEVGADKAAFLKAMGVAAFDRFPAKEYDGAIAALERKRAKTFRSNGSNGVAGNPAEMEHA